MATEPVDYRLLRKRIQKPVAPMVLFTILFLVLILGGSTAIRETDVPPLYLYLGILAILPLAIYSQLTMRSALAGVAALRELIQEEWRTGREILPSDFSVPKGWRLFRHPPALIGYRIWLVRLSQRNWERWKRLLLIVTAGFLSYTLAATVLFLSADIHGILLAAPLAVLLVLWLSTTMAAFAIRQATFFVDGLREYEEISGRQVLPAGVATARRRTLEKP